MKRQLVTDAIGWGFALWLFGYVLGFVLFFVLPTAMIGWVITPIGAALTLWVVLRKLRTTGPRSTVIVSIVWTAIAVVGDYLFIVKALAPPDGYYKADVYLYYALTFLMPFIGILARHEAVTHGAAGA